jgi:NAD-dependent dihydropyrimidine dehydrogenase PreA subunit
MPAIINYKICDLAPECGGITVCPTGAFFWNKKTKRPEVDIKKCISCGVCARTCPAKAILVAEAEKEYQKLVDQIKNDPRSEKDLWRERLGTQPGRTPPLAEVVTPKNFKKKILNAKSWVALDVWSNETLDCRYHSILWEDLKITDRVVFKKLDGGKYSNLAKRLKVSNFPTLIIFKDGVERWRHQGYLHHGDLILVRSKILELLRKL